jgi:dTDP-4-amino-4,6-dideoxygalactose transaminase
VIPQASPGTAIRERRSEYDAAIARVLDSGRYILSKEVETFERDFADYVGAGHCVGVANGTDAVELALRAVGVQAGDAVFTVSHTAVATVAAIMRMGAKPVLVDVDEASFTMDPNRLEAAILDCPGTFPPRAIVPVHLYGAMADMPAVLDVAERHGLKVVEDCAQAHGASLGGRKAGTSGDAAAFSFYPTKNLAAIGDGGAVVSNQVDVASTAREIREYGWRSRYVSERLGVNSRLDELQAAILSVGLSHLDTDNDRRRQVAKTYDAGLAETGLHLPGLNGVRDHVFHQYVIQTPRRDALRDWFTTNGIGTAIHYPVPVHLQPAYRDAVVATELSVTERLAGAILSLPMFPQLTEDETGQIIEVALKWAAANP